MKKFIKGRWFPLLVGITIFVVAAFVMVKFGWRITYAPELENSWDAISACAAWAGVISSFVAIMVAVWIPKKIADRQDKIALFEKRYECYTLVQNFLALGDQIENLQTIKEIQAAFKIYFSNFEHFHSKESASVLAVKLNQQKLLIVSGAFLFPYYNDELLQEIINTGMDLILAVATETKAQTEAPLSEKAIQIKQKYCALCSNFEQNYLDEIESELNLVKNK